MFCESFSFNSFKDDKEDNLETFDRTIEKTEVSSIKKNKNGRNNKLINKNNNKIKNSFNPIIKEKQKNENKNNSSFNITQKVINNYLFIAKNVFLFQELNIKKEFLTEILIGLKKDEKINIPCYSNEIFKYQNSSEINEKHRAVVIEWLSYTVCYFSQSNETLFMSINIMDSYISKKKISLNILQ